MLSPEDVERLIPHLNLYNYGQELLEHFGAVLTDYGMIERRDGQPDVNAKVKLKENAEEIL